MSDIHALSGAYAVDALDDGERIQFEQHLETCPECRAEVRSFCETAALIAGASAERSPREPAGRRTGCHRHRASAPARDPRSHPGRGRHPADRRWFPAMVAAAVAVILLAAGALVWQPWQNGASASLADQVMNAPDAVKVVEPVPGGGRLTVWRSASLKRAVMVADHVPEPQPGTVYELWLFQPGQGAVAAGLMPDSTQPTVFSGNAATATAAAITVEPDTGSRHPTKKPIATFSFKAST